MKKSAVTKEVQNEDQKTEEIFSAESNCTHKVLLKFPALCEALQYFEKEYEENCYANGVANASDVQNLVCRVQSEIKTIVPLEDQVKMSLIADMVGEFIEGDYNDIDPLLWIFKKILKEHVEDKELIEACSYVLNYASESTYE